MSDFRLFCMVAFSTNGGIAFAHLLGASQVSPDGRVSLMFVFAVSAVALKVMLGIRDSGSRSESEDVRSTAEAEGRQSGPKGIAPTPPSNSHPDTPHG